MNIITKYYSLTLCILLLPLFNTVSADEIVLKNGSHLIGEVLKKEGNTLEFKTPFAGTLTIKWKNIIEVKMDKSIKLMLKDNSIQMANTLKIEKNTINISNNNNHQIQTIKNPQLAYINPAPWRLNKGYKMTGGINASLKYQNGNTDKDEFDLDGVITFRRKNDRLMFRAEYENDKDTGTQTSLNWLFLGKYDYFITSKTYLGSSIIFEQDKFADLDLRETYGLHIGHQYFESKAINLSIEGGFAQVYEDFFNVNDNDFFSGTWGIKYKQYFFDEFVQLYHRHLGRFDTEDTDKYIITSWTGLRFPLDFGFSFSAEIQADYDSQPAVSIPKTDTTYLLKLGYDF